MIVNQSLVVRVRMIGTCLLDIQEVLTSATTGYRTISVRGNFLELTTKGIVITTTMVLIEVMVMIAGSLVMSARRTLVMIVSGMKVLLLKEARIMVVLVLGLSQNPGTRVSSSYHIPGRRMHFLFSILQPFYEYNQRGGPMRDPLE